MRDPLTRDSVTVLKSDGTNRGGILKTKIENMKYILPLLLLCTVCKAQVTPSNNSGFPINDAGLIQVDPAFPVKKDSTGIKTQKSIMVYRSFTNTTDLLTINADSSITINGDTIAVIKQLLLEMVRQTKKQDDIIESKNKIIEYGIDWHNEISRRNRIWETKAYKRYCKQLDLNGYKKTLISK